MSPTQDQYLESLIQYKAVADNVLRKAQMYIDFLERTLVKYKPEYAQLFKDKVDFRPKG